MKSDTGEIAVYNLKDLKGILKLSVGTLRKHIKRGKLRAKKVGKSYFVTEANLMAFLDPGRKKVQGHHDDAKSGLFWASWVGN